MNFNFADRYAEAGLAPTPQMITDRQAPADRIVESASSANILALVESYYGSPDIDLAWLRDEFGKEDPSFSLVKNERETRVLSACILGALISSGGSEAILGVLAGSVANIREPAEAPWLLQDAAAALLERSVSERRPGKIETKISPTAVPKLAEELSEVAANDWPALLAVLAKVRSEAQSSARATSSQASSALSALDRQLRLMREETQMLWWLTGGHSRSLERPFASFGQHQAAVVGAIDLGNLTTASDLGPIAAPAMIERVVALARRAKAGVPTDLGSTIDSFSKDDLEELQIFPDRLPARIAPISAALHLARTIGSGAWHGRFEEQTGLKSTQSFDPDTLGEQVYLEHLLGQLL